MRERILVDVRRKHMFLWLWEFWWLVFCENATEQYHELQCALSEPPALTPTEKKCQQEMEAKELFFFSHRTDQQFCAVKRSQEWEAFWFYMHSVLVLLTLTLWLDHQQALKLCRYITKLSGVLEAPKQSICHMTVGISHRHSCHRIIWHSCHHILLNWSPLADNTQ